MGIPTNKVASASINNGCWANPHAGWTLLGGCDLNQNLNANSSPTAGSGVQAADYHPVDPSPTPVKPTLDSAKNTDLWLNASPGPNHPCTTGSAPANFFDNNAGSTSAPDSSLSPGGVPKELTTLLGATAFDCATSTGEIKWTPGGSGITGTLYVTGTIYIDGSITMTGGGELIKLAPDSDGSIYIDGYFSMFNSASLCEYIVSGGCDPTTDGWNPNLNPHDPLIYLAAYNRSNHVPGFDLNGNSNFEGVGYTNGEFNLANSAQIGGSIFADYGLFTGSGNFIVTNVAPTGSLGSVTTTTQLGVAPRTWRQCPVTGCT